MADNRPLSDNEADDRLKAALNALGEAPGVTVAGDTALAAARRALSLLSLGLIAAGVKSELADNNPSGQARASFARKIVKLARRPTRSPLPKYPETS
jgi:hypothetical protein